MKGAPPVCVISTSHLSSCATMKAVSRTGVVGPPLRTLADRWGPYRPYMTDPGAQLTQRRNSSMPMSERYSSNRGRPARSSPMRWLVRSSLAFGTMTRPRPAQSRTPSHGAQVPRLRFSGMAMSRRTFRVSVCQTFSRRSARSTPTTPKMGSSVYMCTK